MNLCVGKDWGIFCVMALSTLSATSQGAGGKAPTAWDDTRKQGWPDEFKRVSIPSGADGALQQTVTLDQP